MSTPARKIRSTSSGPLEGVAVGAGTACWRTGERGGVTVATGAPKAGALAAAFGVLCGLGAGDLALLGVPCTPSVEVFLMVRRIPAGRYAWWLRQRLPEVVRRGH